MKRQLFWVFAVAFAGMGFLAYSGGADAQRFGDDSSLAPELTTASTTLVISQAYGGGGTSSGTYMFDYVELKNVSNTAQSLNGLSLVYGSSTGQFASSATNAFALPNVSLSPGQYYLVQLGSAGTGGAALPVTPDSTTTNLSMGSASGKVALVTSAFVNNTCGATATPCTLPNAAIVDLVSYGASNNAEGGASVNNGVAITSTQGAVRKLAGCQDTDNNNLDFDVVTAPVPRNSTTAAAPCSASTPTPTPTATPTPTPAPFVTSVLPSSGPTTGGTSVTITGTNFTGATAVTFGGTAATTFTVSSPTQITATSPAHAAGTVDVIVTTSGGASAVSANDAFTYTAAPTPTPTPLHVQHVVDFDGNGKTDYTIIRDNGGVSQTWYTLLNDGTNSHVLYQDWGLANPDFAVPADYDGDTKTDYAIWRPPFNGDHAAFWILNSRDGTVSIFNFGQEGDDPSVVGDYDGDGKADIAIIRSDFQANTSTWWVRPTGGPRAGQEIPFQWGLADDYPFPGDFNGDGKADFAVNRADGNGGSVVWIHYGTGSDNIGTADRIDQWGLSTDLFVPGDYDGDGKSDYAIVRNVGGSVQWWVRWSSDNSVHVANWGLGTDSIVQGDYDGDGKTDLAVWRRSDHTFYVLSSATGTPIYTTWGLSATTDVPAAGYSNR